MLTLSRPTVTTPQPHHTSVLLHEVVAALVRAPGGTFIDATCGAGGHSLAILQAAGPEARLLALDADPHALSIAAERLGPLLGQVALKEANFRHIAEVAEEAGFAQVDGIVMDLGLSSMQLDAEERGFSFADTGPLAMTFSPSQELTAADLVNHTPENALADIIYRFGEEPASRRIARAIVAARPIATAAELAAVILRAMGGRRGKTHPATRTFQALRIAVNDELEALRQALPQAVDLLRPGGRLAVISFHSLEDRIVKEYFDQETRDCICPPAVPVCVCGHKAILRRDSRRAITPSQEEIAQNPRSRSAKLRIAQKL
jgi:16S rRNA (cytosine1402-N4)-methyltransferase